MTYDEHQPLENVMAWKYETTESAHDVLANTSALAEAEAAAKQSVRVRGIDSLLRNRIGVIRQFGSDADLTARIQKATKGLKNDFDKAVVVATSAKQCNRSRSYGLKQSLSIDVTATATLTDQQVQDLVAKFDVLAGVNALQESDANLDRIGWDRNLRQYMNSDEWTLERGCSISEAAKRLAEIEKSVNNVSDEVAVRILTDVVYLHHNFIEYHTDELAGSDSFDAFLGGKSWKNDYDTYVGVEETVCRGLVDMLRDRIQITSEVNSEDWTTYVDFNVALTKRHLREILIAFEEAIGWDFKSLANNCMDIGLGA